MALACVFLALSTLSSTVHGLRLVGPHDQRQHQHPGHGGQHKVMLVTVTLGMNQTRVHVMDESISGFKYGTEFVSNFGGQHMIKANRECYAKMHGYETFTVTEENHETLDLPKEGVGVDSDSRWTKVRLFKKLMADRPDIEWFAWIDGDAVIADYHRSLDDILGLASDNQHVIIPSAEIGCLWSSNHFYVRNSQEGRDFVQKWLDKGKQNCIFAKIYRGCTFGDQCYMWNAVTDIASEMYYGDQGDKNTSTSLGDKHVDRVRVDTAHCNALQSGSELATVEQDFYGLEEDEPNPLANATRINDRMRVAVAFGVLGKMDGAHDCRLPKKHPDRNLHHRHIGPFVFAAYNYLLHDCARGVPTEDDFEHAFIFHKPRGGCHERYEAKWGGSCPSH